MNFLYEKQTRRFYILLAVLCILQIFLLGVCGIVQTRSIRRVLVERELAAVSYLMEEGVPPSVAASAWNRTKVTEEGAKLLEKIGHTTHTQSYLLLLTEQTSLPLILWLLSEGILFAAILLGCVSLYLRRREKLYEKAEMVVTQYGDNQFDRHLPSGETGAVYQLFWRIEQLALSLQAKSQMEYKAKEFLKDMLSDISHQLKTPLAALYMYMEIMAEEADHEDTVKDFTRKSMGSLNRMGELIQSLLKIARLDTGNILFEKRQCFAAEMAAEAAADLMERAEREGKKILTEGDPGELVFCDFGWTKEAVGNLIKNALDHTKRGGTIRVSWNRSPMMVCLNVEDDGCGIAPEDIHHIFKRFYRSRRSGSRQGAGLGLPLAKSIVEDQGGNLSVESTLGEGAVFRMTFPCQK